MPEAKRQELRDRYKAKMQELRDRYTNDSRVQHMLKEVENSEQEIVDINREKVMNMEPKFANLKLILEREESMNLTILKVSKIEKSLNRQLNHLR